MPRVFIKPFNRVVDIGYGETLLDAIKSVYPEYSSPCGGRGLCGKCIVRVVEGVVSKPTGNEFLHNVLSRGYRLACQTRVYGDTVIELDHVLKGCVECSIETFNQPLAVDNPLPQSILNGLREHMIYYDGECFREFSRSYLSNIASLNKRLYIGVDLGTTKIALYFYDIEERSLVSSDLLLNPQSRYGDDVVSRLTTILYDRSVLERMRILTIEAIEDKVVGIVSGSGYCLDDIAFIGVAGNTAMLSIFLGVDPTPLTRSPYRSPLPSSFIITDARALCFKKLPTRPILVPPVFKSFVGSDALADLVVVSRLGARPPYLLIDIGTNSEIVLVKSSREYYVTSAPAGPAIEGMHLSCGVGYSSQAIRRLWITSNGFKWKPLIDKPVGITGSGYVSAIADFRRHNIVSENGVLLKWDRVVNGSKTIVIQEVDGEPRIYITQSDVREFQKAKAAIASAWRVLLDKAGLGISDLCGVYIAGSFGSSLDPIDLIEIGVIPSIPLDKVFVVGNAVGLGVIQLLLSRSYRLYGYRVVRRAVHIELPLEDKFSRYWIESLKLKRVEG